MPRDQQSQGQQQKKKMVIHWNTSRKAIISARLNKVGPSHAQAQRSSGGKPLARCQLGEEAMGEAIAQGG